MCLLWIEVMVMVGWGISSGGCSSAMYRLAGRNLTERDITIELGLFDNISGSEPTLVDFMDALVC